MEKTFTDYLKPSIGGCGTPPAVHLLHMPYFLEMSSRQIIPINVAFEISLYGRGSSIIYVCACVILIRTNGLQC